MKRSIQKGFTLIELMIVVAIIGILAAVALPAYQDYTARAQASEAITLADGVKKSIEISFPNDGACPANTTAAEAAAGNIAIATSITGSHVLKVVSAGTASATGGCTVEATFKATGVNQKLVSRVVTYTLAVNGTTSSWTCTSTLDASVRPKTCTAAAAAAETK